MLYKIKLTNAEDHVILNDYVFEFFSNDVFYKSINFINRLRKHSTGCAVFQKSWPKAGGGFKIETIYLHKFIAEKWLADKITEKDNLVGAINGDKLDCRVENLMLRSKATMSRQRKTRSTSGYTGVSKDGTKFRAVIAVNRKHIHLGMFETAEDAAAAYNKKSLELFGDAAKINVIKTQPARINRKTAP
ncbi:MAG: Pathogenesis-related transcriptional factor and ERF protein [Saprospiraceae bacterium]